MAMLNNQRITNAVSTQFRKLTVRFWRRYHELNRRDSKPSSRLNGLSVQADATPLLCSWKLPRSKEPKMKCSLDWFCWENLGKILTGNPWFFLPLNWSGFPVKIFPRKPPKIWNVPPHGFQKRMFLELVPEIWNGCCMFHQIQRSKKCVKTRRKSHQKQRVVGWWPVGLRSSLQLETLDPWNGGAAVPQLVNVKTGGKTETGGCGGTCFGKEWPGGLRTWGA